MNAACETPSWSASRDAVLLVVQTELRALLPRNAAVDVHERSLLIEELGLDSLKFVDLTVNLEDALSIVELPMQAWVDHELEHGRKLTVGSLVEVCQIALLSRRADREAHAEHV